MTVKIEYNSPHNEHITINTNGTIEIWINDQPVIIEYRQALQLKKMIVAECKLDDR